MPYPGKEKKVMKDWWELIVFILFVAGGGCALTGTWRNKNKKKEKDADEYKDRKQ